MASPLTNSRNRKLQIIEEMHGLCFKIVKYQRSGLDRMDMRVLKRLLKELKELEFRAKPTP